MTVDDLVNYYGTAIKAAKAAGYCHTIVYMWKTRGKIPLGAQYHYEILTKGELKAGN